MESHITILDFAVLPYVLTLVYGIAYYIRNKKYPPGHPLRKYFISALTVKIIGALLISFIYEYYYGYGDTFAYFKNANYLNKLAFNSFDKFINLFFHIASPADPVYAEEISELATYHIGSNYMVTQFTTVLGLLTFNTFLPTAILFAALSFTGIWLLFLVFARRYPKLLKPLSYAILFFPSVCLWGSGIFKDTLCIMALGWLTFSSFEIFLNHRFTRKQLLLFLCSFWILIVTKIYIISAFLPAMIMWIISINASKIRNSVLRFLFRLAFPLLLLLVFFLASNQINEALGQYSFDKITTTSELLRTNLQLVTIDQQGSGYDLGEIEPTPIGLIKKIPAAINVTLFRPYFWESKNVLSLFNTLESTILFLLTVWLIVFKKGFNTLFSLLRHEKTAAFCFVFVLLFAFAIGISTYNFGSLSRYRIPCLPYYGVFLILLYHYYPRQKV